MFLRANSETITVQRFDTVELRKSKGKDTYQAYVLLIAKCYDQQLEFAPVPAPTVLTTANAASSVSQSLSASASSSSSSISPDKREDSTVKDGKAAVTAVSADSESKEAKEPSDDGQKEVKTSVADTASSLASSPLLQSASSASSAFSISSNLADQSGAGQPSEASLSSTSASQSASSSSSATSSPASASSSASPSSAPSTIPSVPHNPFTYLIPVGASFSLTLLVQHTQTKSILFVGIDRLVSVVQTAAIRLAADNDSERSLRVNLGSRTSSFLDRYVDAANTVSTKEQVKARPAKKVRTPGKQKRSELLREKEEARKKAAAEESEKQKQKLEEKKRPRPKRVKDRDAEPKFPGVHSDLAAMKLKADYEAKLKAQAEAFQAQLAQLSKTTKRHASAPVKAEDDDEEEAQPSSKRRKDTSRLSTRYGHLQSLLSASISPSRR